MDKKSIEAVVLSLTPQDLGCAIEAVNLWNDEFSDGTPTISTARELIDLLSRPEYAGDYPGTTKEYFQEAFGLL